MVMEAKATVLEDRTFHDGRLVILKLEFPAALNVPLRTSLRAMIDEVNEQMEHRGSRAPMRSARFGFTEKPSEPEPTTEHRGSRAPDPSNQYDKLFAEAL
jgi:hypothetical protein